MLLPGLCLFLRSHMQQMMKGRASFFRSMSNTFDSRVMVTTCVRVVASDHNYARNKKTTVISLIMQELGCLSTLINLRIKKEQHVLISCRPIGLTMLKCSTQESMPNRTGFQISQACTKLYSMRIPGP